MMVVDTSAIIAILLQEEDAQRYADAIEATEQPLVSAASVVEAGIVLHARQGPKAVEQLGLFLEEGGFQIEGVTSNQAWRALDGFARFGKGQGNEAQLNYGDCFAYALAKETDQPLLFKGKDFVHTDIKAA